MIDESNGRAGRKVSPFKGILVFFFFLMGSQSFDIINSINHFLLQNAEV